ncbi:MAG: cytoplasmic fragile-X interacting family-domain-containing protein [Olpidium bornovanus]|uniref:Cytoplasmic fragile-X interacting family-domain-containing protein n=1 Tax=Olpidium bornovanus TaxID=278681 RepID=A0A8H8DGJ6_9FUNG|nr:MAG: cytoplasmic fragile-X interacting family-domain-containing protein [Olpidium bornovanus]
MAFGLSLADLPGDERDVTKKKKQLRIDRFLKIVRALPVVPLFGDMSIRLSSIFTKTPHLSALKWDPVVDHPTVAASYSLLAHVETAQKEYDDLVCDLGQTVNTAYQIEEGDEQAPAAARQAYSMMLKGLLFVSQLTAKVLEQAVRYNYSSDELLAAFRYVSMIKELVGILSKADGLLFSVIRRHVYTDVQLFPHEIQQARRAGDPEAKVLHLLRPGEGSSIYRNCYNEKAKGMKGGLLKEKDLKENQVEEMNLFSDRSFYYGAMLNYMNALAESSDLSDLWYKEFYLELSHEIQFPIEMSLPWMITERGLDGEDVETLE